MINGVDISNPHRTFTAIEFQNLGASGRQYITMMREQAGSNTMAGNVMGGSRSLSVNEASMSIQAAAAESVQSDVHGNAAINPRGGRNGARFGQAAHNNRS
jgi:hypothetical protein